MARKTTDAFKKLVGAYSSGDDALPLEEERHDLRQENALSGVVSEEAQQQDVVDKSDEKYEGYTKYKSYNNSSNSNNSNNSHGYQNYEKRAPGRPKRVDGKENKSRHFNLLLRPSTYIALEQIARLDGGSISDILNSLAEDYIKVRAEDLASFRLLLKK